MARPRENPSALAIYRMNMGKNIKTVAREAALSSTTLMRLELGEEVTREYAARYLHVLGIDLNNVYTIPETIEIVDLGGRIKVLSRQ